MGSDTIEKPSEDMRIQRVPEGRRGRVARTRQNADISQLPVARDEANARSQPVPRSRKKRRVALALRDIEPEAPPHVRLRHRDGGPTAVEKGEWIDPDDVRPNVKTGRIIRGYHTAPSLEKIARVSREITDEHILVAKYIAIVWDVARVGFQGERDGTPVTQIVHLPRLDFSGASHAQVRAVTEFKRIWSTLWEWQQRMASVILLANHSVNFWCGYEEQRMGHRPDAKIELGKLVGMMDHLWKYLEADIDEAKQKNRMRA